ncbi:MAG: single-stranded DNA-binding protein [Dehalococcoidia bacterium]|nr:single-stranded DNA-binding protein [Dehalococcoidia bacterium]
MANLNKCMIIGFVGKDPEMRFTPEGTAVCGFSVAVNNFYTTADGEKKQDTEWFTVTAWAKLAETVNQFVVKGMLIYVEGMLKTRSWEDANSGQRRYRTELVARQIQFLSKVDKTAPAEEDIFADEGLEPTEPEDLSF